MTIDVLRLGESAESISAALLLRNEHNIRVRALPSQASELLHSGFIEAPQFLSCFIDLTSEDILLESSYNKNLRISLEAWQRQGVEFVITDVENFGINRLIEQVYFPIFVRDFYSRGISPYGAHNLESFKNILKPSMYVALGYKKGKVVVAALLDSNSSDSALVSVRGAAPNEPWVEGLIVACSIEGKAIRRAFISILASALKHIGHKWFSLGRDLTWMGSGYCNVLLEKLSISTSVAISRGSYRYLHWWSPAILQNEGVFFGLDRNRLFACALTRITPVIEKIGKNLCIEVLLIKSLQNEKVLLGGVQFEANKNVHWSR